MRRVVITGATSMIAVALIKECIAHHIDVLAITRPNSKNLGRLPESEHIQILECAIDQLGTIEETGMPYDVFYHMAWDYTSKETRDNPVLQEKNIAYTLDAVRLAHRLGCKLFIGAGSQAEYGRVDGMIKPDTREYPVIAYGMAKNAARQLSQKLCNDYGMMHIWARIFSVYGRYDNPGTMLVYAISRFLQGEKADFSAATQYWDYLHEEDAGRAFYLLGQKGKTDKIYCVASGDARPLKDYIMELIGAFGPEASYSFAPENGSAQPIGIRADISDLMQDTGFQPKVPFAEGIRDMIESMRSNI